MALFINSQKLETTQVEQGMDKQIVAYPYHGILLSTKRNKILIYSITWGNLKITWVKKVKHRDYIL